ncbi:hypothetical protein [Methylomicrobium album]|uniref:hypothetical protein n=1 Tax=Methylomicrobium album TaxID=39775 RepID=UPI001BC8964E|nr:hypothetical protein [Methylomicrobium album]
MVLFQNASKPRQFTLAGQRIFNRRIVFRYFFDCSRFKKSRTAASVRWRINRPRIVVIEPYDTGQQTNKRQKTAQRQPYFEAVRTESRPGHSIASTSSGIDCRGKQKALRPMHQQATSTQAKA